jgi:hypothetical protein
LSRKPQSAEARIWPTTARTARPGQDVVRSKLKENKMARGKHMQPAGKGRRTVRAKG